MDKPTTVRVTISLTPERLKKLDRMAAAVARTRSNAITKFIDASPDPKAGQ